MRNKYNVLVFTDHSGHSKENSIYALLQAMITDKRCNSVHVASRGLEENREFFEDCNKDRLFATQIDEEFAYTENGYFMSHKLEEISIETADVVFLRLPRPISDDFLLWISEIFKKAVIINDPKGILATSSKRFLLNLSQYCPPIKMCDSIKDIKDFALKFPIVLKPLQEYGGRGLLKIESGMVDDGKEVFELDEYLLSIKDYIEDEGYLAMQFMKNVKEGDKRILVVDGEVLAASLRLPPEGSWLCNVAQGGKSVPTKPSAEEIKIINGIAPELKNNGILMYGIDTLVNDEGQRMLSEINTLSIGGFPQSEKQSGKPVLRRTIEKIFDYADENYEN